MSGTFSGRVAFARVAFTGGTPSIVMQSGDFAPEATDGGIGKVSLTLVNPIEPSEAIYLVSCRAVDEGEVVDNGVASVGSNVSSTLVPVLIRDPGDAELQDLAFDLTILVKPLQ